MDEGREGVVSESPKDHVQFVGLIFDADLARWVSNVYLSSCSGMIFPFTLYVPLKLGFLEAARYIAVILPVVVVEKRADTLLIPFSADPSASSFGGLAGKWQLVLFL